MNEQIELITERERLAALEVPWRLLCESTGADVFQSHAWIMAWSNSLSGRGYRLRIAVAWRGDELVATLPLVIRPGLLYRGLEWASEFFADYCDALIAPGGDGQLLPALWSAIDRAGGFDVVRLNQVRPDGRVKQLLDSTATGWGKLKLRETKIPCLGLANAWTGGEAWFRTLKKKARNNFTRGRRILTELGGDAEFRIVTADDPQAEAVLDRVLALKRHWLEENEPGSPFLGREGDSLRAVLISSLRAGSGRIFLLTCGGTIAAASFNFVYEKRLQAYLTSYDPQYERASPGTILMVHYIKWAFDSGFLYVDFLRGDEPFKYRFANTVTPLNNYIGAQTLVGRVLLVQQHCYTGMRDAWKRRFRPVGEDGSRDLMLGDRLVEEH
jgi:CelD/BcsL family acetyltransferase involved in cellulose biosynthesis